MNQHLSGPVGAWTFNCLPLWKRVAIALSGAVLLGGGSALVAPPASAAQYTVAYTDGDGVAVRSAPTADSKVSPMVVLAEGTVVDILCQQMSTDGSSVGPRDNRVFDKILVAPLSPAEVWIPDAYVSGTAAANTFTEGIPRCDQQPSSSGEFTPQPDLGVYCALAGPGDTMNIRYKLTSYGYGDQPTCKYTAVSEGDYEAGIGGIFPAFIVPFTQRGDWGEACRTNYGPSSWAEKSGNSAICHNVDMDYNARAQAQAVQSQSDWY